MQAALELCLRKNVLPRTATVKYTGSPIFITCTNLVWQMPLNNHAVALCSCSL